MIYDKVVLIKNFSFFLNKCIKNSLIKFQNLSIQRRLAENIHIAKKHKEMV